MDKIDWVLVWNIYCWCAGVCVIFSAIFSRKKPLTNEEKWAVFHEVAQAQSLMPDGQSYQRIEWRWVPCEPAVTDAANPRASVPQIRVAGRAQA